MRARRCYLDRAGTGNECGSVGEETLRERSADHPGRRAENPHGFCHDGDAGIGCPSSAAESTDPASAFAPSPELADGLLRPISRRGRRTSRKRASGRPQSFTWLPFAERHEGTRCTAGTASPSCRAIPDRTSSCTSRRRRDRDTNARTSRSRTIAVRLERRARATRCSRCNRRLDRPSRASASRPAKIAPLSRERAALSCASKMFPYIKGLWCGTAARQPTAPSECPDTRTVAVDACNPTITFLPFDCTSPPLPARR